MVCLSIGRTIENERANRSVDPVAALFLSPSVSVAYPVLEWGCPRQCSQGKMGALGLDPMGALVGSVLMGYSGALRGVLHGYCMGYCMGYSRYSRALYGVLQGYSRGTQGAVQGIGWGTVWGTVWGTPGVLQVLQGTVWGAPRGTPGVLAPFGRIIMGHTCRLSLAHLLVLQGTVWGTPGYCMGYNCRLSLAHLLLLDETAHESPWSVRRQWCAPLETPKSARALLDAAMRT